MRKNRRIKPKGIDRLYAAITREASNTIARMRSNPADVIEFNKIFFVSLVGKSYPSDKIYYKPSKRDLFRGEILREIHSLSSPYEHMMDIEVYMRRFPYNGTRVNKIRHLKFNITSHYEHVYILGERMVGILRRLERHYKYRTSIQINKEPTKSFLAALKSTFNYEYEIRGSHVHKVDFGDNDLNRLESIELFLRFEIGPLKQLLSIIYKDEYNVHRRKWVEKIRLANQHFQKILDIYSDTIYPILFYKNGKLRFPKGM